MFINLFRNRKKQLAQEMLEEERSRIAQEKLAIELREACYLPTTSIVTETIKKVNFLEIVVNTMNSEICKEMTRLAIKQRELVEMENACKHSMQNVYLKRRQFGR